NAVTNPNVPQLVHTTNGGQRDVPGGDTASNTGAAAALNGIQFGPGGAPEAYRLGSCAYYAAANLPPYIASTTTNSTSYCVGGTSNLSTSSAELDLLSFPIQQGTGFFYGSYKITPDIQASLQLNYGYDRSHSSSSTVVQSANIKTDNAFLNPNVLAA